jgi:hypothetical protein
VKTRAGALVALALLAGATGAGAQGVVVDHRHGRLLDIPATWIQEARQTLHIAYGHTSHGSQLVTGMTAVQQQHGALYAFAAGGTGGALDLRDTPFSGASDLGNPNFTAWATATRNYLNANPTVNVVIWSWCGQVSGATEANINTYLSLMSQLEADYSGVRFVYMTGHLDGGGATGSLNVRNEQIRTYCRNNNKILFDFADIESYDPDRAVNYMTLQGNDNCDYYQGTWRNWATTWAGAHPGDERTLTGNRICSGCCAHSQPLNCVQKAGAAWWLWAQLAGWSPNGVQVTSISPVGGPITGGTTVTVRGSGFVAGATVAIGGVAATDVVVAGSTALTAVTGAHATGLADVTVTIPGPQSATLAQAFFFAPPPAATDYYTLTPCRLVDTRFAEAPALAANERRVFAVTGGACGVPSTATAMAVNLTVTGAAASGYILLAPGNGLTDVGALSFSAGQTRANNAVVRLSTDGTGGVSATNGSTGPAHLILDVAGYFE